MAASSVSDADVYVYSQLYEEPSESSLPLELRSTLNIGLAGLGLASGFFGQGRLGLGTGGALPALLGMSPGLSLDDPAGPDLPGVTPGRLPEVTPGGGGGGGGGGGAFAASPTPDDLLLAPEGEILLGAFLSVPILEFGLYLSGRLGADSGPGILKHAKAIGERLAVAKMACG